jgi:hypothetical protein
MSGLAALAVKEAAVASGLGTTFLPGVAPSAVEGFAVGTLLSGLCFLLVIAPRRRFRRRSRSARKAMRASATQTLSSHDLPGHVAASAYAATGVISDPFADESAEVLVSYPVQEVSLELPDQSNGGSSRHRLTGTEARQRPEARRSAGRHAAPPSSARMASKRVAR